MPKGRLFAPASNNDGIWFPHRGLPDAGPLLRDVATDTGQMLSAPYKPDASYYPPQPPQPYQDKNARNFKKSNLFSAHDNRHSFQDHGIYFGDAETGRTLGKCLLRPDRRQHWTSKAFLQHSGHRPPWPDYQTQYETQYRGQPTDSRPTRRRFPKIHSDPDPSRRHPDTVTTDWVAEGQLVQRTPTHVLAVSQQPLLPANTWKHSYHGQAKCYPSYNINTNKYRTWLLPGISTAKISAE